MHPVVFQYRDVCFHEFQLFDMSGTTSNGNGENEADENYEHWQFNIGLAVVLIITALTLHLGSYLNSTLIGWNNMWDMTIDLIQLLIRRGFGKQNNYPLEGLSFLILVLGLIFLILGLIPGS